MGDSGQVSGLVSLIFNPEFFHFVFPLGKFQHHFLKDGLNCRHRKRVESIKSRLKMFPLVLNFLHEFLEALGTSDVFKEWIIFRKKRVIDKTP